MTSLKDITHSLILTAGLLVLPLSGCDTNTVSHHYCHIPPEGWRRNDTVHLHTDTLQQDGTYQLSIGLRCPAGTNGSPLMRAISTTAVAPSADTP